MLKLSNSNLNKFVPNIRASVIESEKSTPKNFQKREKSQVNQVQPR